MTETGADVTARHVHVQGVKAGSLVMASFLESATDEEAIAAALEAAGFGKDVIAQSEVKISNIEIHKRHIGKGMAEEEIRKREEESAARRDPRLQDPVPERGAALLRAHRQGRRRDAVQGGDRRGREEGRRSH